MAAVAGVEVGGCGKLTGMPILVAIGTEVELHPVECVLALWNMALIALDPRVTALERVLCRSMLLHGEKRRLPPLHLVAGGALAGIGTLGKLSVVRVLVAIGALGERDRLFKIAAAGVALFAIHFRVFALEGVLGLGVVEALVYGLAGSLLPSGGGVAGGTGLRKAAVMRVFVAV